MRAITRGDVLRRLRKVGVAGKVQAAQALEAFRLYMASEFPAVAATDYEPLFVQNKILVVRTQSAALQHILNEHEVDISRYITQAAGITVEHIRFRP